MSAVSDYRSLSNHISMLCKQLNQTPTQCQILVNIEQQRLNLMRSQELIKSYVISTASKGEGQAEGSGKTPLGLHAITSKIGEGAHPYAIFKGRVPIGEIAQPNGAEESIVGRILWLKGLEPEFNLSTQGRYIYIHGTNDLENLGKRVSGGCIRMNPLDVIELFDQVDEGTQVYIYC